MNRVFLAFYEMQNGAAETWKLYKRLLSASIPAGIALLIVELFLGGLIVFEILALSKLIVALVGAQSVQVVTSDVRNAALWQIGLVVAAVPAMLFQKQFQGVGAAVGIRIREAALAVTSLVVALPLSPILFPFLNIVGYYVPLLKNRWANLLMSVVLLGIGLLVFYGAVEGVVYHTITMEQFIAWGGALLVNVSWIALRPYLPK